MPYQSRQRDDIIVRKRGSAEVDLTDQQRTQEAEGRAWVIAELRAIARERGLTLDAVTWSSDFDRDTHYVHVSVGEVRHTVPIASEDLEDVANDLGVQDWLGKHLRRAIA